ncbi:uncharacterized protein LOC129586739 isoform X2 [Paramacrobiotus metropolitanus]|uniref:uncharacterized protein LOC129586739 isoform X2 n=1 Tax=Paramacrobiotus metropolitanus TaxID=2943436 RepID=UPI002445D612|nr:uncharacterized protein LOC129586739 isoform X2 [Paramacrobiotus metropolitanus]
MYPNCAKTRWKRRNRLQLFPVPKHIYIWKVKESRKLVNSARIHACACFTFSTTRSRRLQTWIFRLTSPICICRTIVSSPLKICTAYHICRSFEGLETNSQLNELHVDHQKLADGESLVLDPRSASMLQRCLLTLDISGNNIRDLGNFQHLRNLTGLFLSDNQLANINLFLTVLEKLADLRYLRVSGNPLSKTMRYREKIIMATSCLEILDGKTVSAQNKQFLSSMLHSRHPFPPCEVPSGMRSSDMNARSFNGMDGLLLPNVVSGTKVTDRIRTVADGDGPVRCAMPARSAPKLRKIPSAMLAQQEQILRKLQLRM